MNGFFVNVLSEEFNRLKKKLSNYDEKQLTAINILKEYEAYMSSMKEMCSATKSFYAKNSKGVCKNIVDANGKKTEEFIQLIEKYKAFRESAAALLACEQLKNENSKLYRNIRETQRAVSKDISLFITFKSIDELSLPELVYRSNAKLYDIKHMKIKKVGNMQSSRIIMEIIDADGRSSEGFFTEEMKHDLPMKYFFESIENEEKKNASDKELLKRIHDYVDKRLNANDIIQIAEYYRIGSDVNDKVMRYLTRKHIYDAQIVENKYFKDAIKAVIKRTKANLQPWLNFERSVTSKANIDRRNSAMSDIAELLGMSGLIAEAEDVKIRDKQGKVINGTFMKHADGVPLEAVNGNKVRNDKYTLGLRKDLCNLAVLDYICLNNDRHLRNMFYKVDRDDNILGVVGIDNDSSFGRVMSFEGKNFNRLVNLKYIKYFPKDTAESICNVDEKDIASVMESRGLNKGEIKAALVRLKACKDIAQAALNNSDKIKSNAELGYVSALSDENLMKVGMKDFIQKETGIGTENYSTFEELVSYLGRGRVPIEHDAINYENKGANEVDDMRERLQSNANMLIKYRDDLKAATYFNFRSEKYHDIENAIIESIGVYESVLGNKGETKMNISIHDYKKCMESMKHVADLANIYITNKEREHSLSRYATKRLNLVRNFRQVLSRNINQTHYTMDVEKDEMEVMNINKRAMKEAENIRKTEELMNIFINSNMADKVSIICKDLPKLSVNSYGRFYESINATLVEFKDSANDENKRICNNLKIAQTIAKISKEGQEAYKVLNSNSEYIETQYLMLQNSNQVKDKDEYIKDCVKKVVAYKLLESRMDTRNTADTQKDFEKLYKKVHKEGLKSYIDNYVKSSRMYADLISKEPQQIIQFINDNSLVRQKEFASMNREMNDILDLSSINKNYKILKAENVRIK